MVTGCNFCLIRKLAERKPDSWIARLWRWHTGWCPGWKAYQRQLADDSDSTGRSGTGVAPE